jgi:hypothetical protein
VAHATLSEFVHDLSRQPGLVPAVLAGRRAAAERLRRPPTTAVPAVQDRRELAVAVTMSHQPISFNAGTPGKIPQLGARVVAAAYSYNKADAKITTQNAIDQMTASLLTQGPGEGVAPAILPNTGRLMTVGAVNVGPFETAAFDIHGLIDLGFAALSGRDGTVSRWIEIDLVTGAGRIVGTIGGGETLRALAFESF